MEKQVKKHNKYGVAFGLGISSVSILGVALILGILSLACVLDLIDYKTIIPHLLTGAFAVVGAILFLIEGIFILKKEDFGKLKAKSAGILLICSSIIPMVFCLPFVLRALDLIHNVPSAVIYISVGVTVLFALFLLVFGIVIVVFMAKKNKKS